MADDAALGSGEEVTAARGRAADRSATALGQDGINRSVAEAVREPKAGAQLSTHGSKRHRVAQTDTDMRQQFQRPRILVTGGEAPGALIFQGQRRFIAQLVGPTFHERKVANLVNSVLRFLAERVGTDDAEIKLPVIQHRMLVCRLATLLEKKSGVKKSGVRTVFTCSAVAAVSVGV